MITKYAFRIIRVELFSFQIHQMPTILLARRLLCQIIFRNKIRMSSAWMTDQIERASKTEQLVLFNFDSVLEIVFDSWPRNCHLLFPIVHLIRDGIVAFRSIYCDTIKKFMASDPIRHQSRQFLSDLGSRSIGEREVNRNTYFLFYLWKD